MKKRINFLTIVVLLFAITAVAASFVLLFTPTGNGLAGSAENSSAISASLALIIATIGLVIALWMQTAEYRRETEIVDGLQEARALLDIMIARMGVAQGTGQSDANLSFATEKEHLILILKGPAGRLLNYIRIVRHTSAQKNDAPEKWRTFYIHVSNVVNSDDLSECGGSLCALLDLLKSVTSADVRKYSNKVISVDSIDALNAGDDIVVSAYCKTQSENRERAAQARTSITADTLEKIIEELSAKLNESPQGVSALAELQESITDAREGSDEAIGYLVSLHSALVATAGDGKAPSS